ncbi:carbon storage regulator [bacterium]|nr:carbon storage regulator [bacterium]
MLVITRKNGQKIMINDNIEITVVEAKNGSCRIAIQADKDVKIYREEIYLQIKLANLVGKSTNVSAVDSVSDLIKSGTTLNDKNIEKSASEEVIVDNTNSKSIIIKKHNEGSK